MKKVYVIIPTFNEHENIHILLRKLKNLKIIHKIIIVDDSNNFLTKKKIFETKIKVKYYKRSGKKGRGSAVIYGLKKIIKFLKKDDLIVEMDADLSHDPFEIKKNLKYFKKKKCNLLISSRYLNGSNIINWDLKRTILSKISNILARLLLGVPVSDYTNGFRIYSKEASKLIIKKCGNIGDGFIILSEILICIHKAGLKICERKTNFLNRERGESNVNLSLIIASFLGLIKLFFIKKDY